MISFSKNAENEILSTLNSDSLPKNYKLRIGIKGGACSALYIIGLDTPTENDEIHTFGKIEAIIDRRHLMYLIGVKIDYQNLEDNTGYMFSK